MTALLKDSLSTFGEFMAISRNPEFRSKSSLTNSMGGGSSTSINSSSNVAFPAGSGAVEAKNNNRNRRHSLNIICGTAVESPDECIRQHSFSPSAYRKSSSSSVSLKSFRGKSSPDGGGKSDEDEEANETGEKKNWPPQKEQRRLSEPFLIAKPKALFRFGSFQRQRRGKLQQSNERVVPKDASPEMEAEQGAKNGANNKKETLGKSLQLQQPQKSPSFLENPTPPPRTPRTPLFNFSFSVVVDPIQEQEETEPHQNHSAATIPSSNGDTRGTGIIKQLPEILVEDFKNL